MSEHPLPSPSSPGEPDWQRLASGLAMLTGEPGEAENAGRVVGVLARRLGLSGGDLKRIFLAGMEGKTAASPAGGDEGDLHESLARWHAEALAAGRERDRLREETCRLGAELARLRGRGRLGILAGGAGLAALVLLAGGLWLDRPAASRVSPPVAAHVAPGARIAIVREGGATLFSGPQEGPARARLAPGQRVVVRRLIWNALFQWADVEVPGGPSGYLRTTELDLS